MFTRKEHRATRLGSAVWRRAPWGDPSDPSWTITSVLPRGQFYVRLEHDQWRFARERARAYDAAIIPARYCAPYPDTHPSAGQDHLRLATAVTEARRPLVVEPDTAPMLASGIARYDSAARLRATAAASVVELPLTVEQLRSAQRRDAFVDASMQDQRLARAVAPPHLDVRSANDERLALNLLMLRRVVISAGVQMPVAFIQVTRAVLLHGVLGDVARQYAATGVQRVFMRVRGVGEDASADDLVAYLDAVDAFTKCGVDVVADCVGRLGPVLVHGGALGFSSGGMFFRRVGEALLSAGGGGGGMPVSIEHAWGDVERGGDGVAALGPCAVAGCRLSAADATLDDVREHRVHTLRHLGRLATAQDTDELIRSLRASGRAQPLAWAKVLAARRRRAA